MGVMSVPINFAEIRGRLIQSIDQLAREMAPEGRRNGNYWIARNPTRADKRAGSFWILLKGPAAGAWRDEAGVRGVDEGDVVDLVRYCRRLPDLKETRRECLKWLGLSDTGGTRLSAAEIAARDKARAEQRAVQDAEEAQKREKNRTSALGLWLRAAELTPQNFPGSVIDRYLRSRAIDLTAGLIEQGRPLPGCMRFYPAHDYRTADGEIFEGFPAIATLLTGPDGKPRGLHRTWLQPDGSGKATLPEPGQNKPRKIWPAGWQGGVMRIAKGAGGWSPEEAAKRGTKQLLIVTEGLEDALACALAMPDARVWAAGTLGNIAHVPLMPCVARVIVAADNDWGKGQAEEQLRRGVATLRATGMKVSVARSPKGKDMNDLLKGERI